MTKAPPAKQVRLRLVRIDVWSAVRNAFVVTLALSTVLLVFNLVTWLLLTVLGVIDIVNTTISDIIGVDFLGLTDLMSFPSMLVFTLLTALVNIVCGTALGALWAVAFNFIARITGGLRVAFTND
ncbi:MAG: DUF3566 domain-containing protein [Microbacteriaceae bacterium]|jgi:hypothetical protein